ncbi:hypothetical protein LNP26_03945 [Klebsiella variicola subsp. variicola]|nr:hypothetical protein [Klebsiella variicola subsp. variicola]
MFANNSSKILLFGFGSGYGVVRNKATGKDTYMKMARGGAGLGMGIKQQRTVLVFHDKAAPGDLYSPGIHGWRRCECRRKI